jgi:hypothetical protein
LRDFCVACNKDVVNAITHNKTMVIDGETVITEFFNFTKAASEKNAGNLRTFGSC